MKGSTGLAEAPVITRARAAQELAVQAAAVSLATAAEWAEANPALFTTEAAFGEETGLPLAGDGAPLVAEFAVVQYATLLGLTQTSGRQLIGDALELKHRLPRCWTRVQALEVPAWKARRLAQATRLLSLEAAAWVDAQLAPFLHGLGWAQQDRTLAEALDRFQPDLAEDIREQAAETRHVDIDHLSGEHYDGTSRIEAILDTPDALDLESAIAGIAHDRLTLGDTDSLDVRRAKALGELARHQHTLALDLAAPEGFEARSARTPTNSGRRQATLYLHLDPATGRGWTDQAGSQLLTADTIREWLTHATVTIRPVIDLNEQLQTDSYTPTPVMREQAILLNPTCVFPHCTKPSRSCDLDHIIEYDLGGQTLTINLAPLCRLHHRVKTHDDWTYRALRPGLYQWTDPLGHGYLVDNHGTTTHVSPRLLPSTEPPDE